MACFKHLLNASRIHNELTFGTYPVGEFKEIVDRPFAFVYTDLPRLSTGSVVGKEILPRTMGDFITEPPILLEFDGAMFAEKHFQNIQQGILETTDWTFPDGTTQPIVVTWPVLMAGTFQGTLEGPYTEGSWQTDSATPETLPIFVDETPIP